jgi:aryl-alcohol dehydrogenase-like predicted oxidoreductase
MSTPTNTNTRRLGRRGRHVSALGLGCWAIGGPTHRAGRPSGWGDVDDEESVRAIRVALDLGVTLFDTAAAYGCGRSERVLGRALGTDRERVAIATKFGYVLDESTGEVEGIDLSADGIRRACEASLRRLGTDRIDLYQLHVGDAPDEALPAVRDVLEELILRGRIGAYGWSTDDAGRLRSFATGGCSAVQASLNVFDDAPMLTASAELELALICRSPLAMGLLTGKFGVHSRLPANDVRAAGWDWCDPWFRDGRPAPEALAAVAAVREVLTSGGRTPAQGALAWIWARGSHTIPIPGFKTPAQVEENAGALRFGPLTAGQMAEIDRILGRTSEPSVRTTLDGSAPTATAETPVIDAPRWP